MDKRIDPKFLKEMPFFAGLSDDQLGLLASMFEVRMFKKGDAIIMQGEVGTGMYIIIFGEVEVTIDNVPKATLKVNDFFGEMALIADEPRNATVTVSSDDLSVFYLSRKAFKAIQSDLGDDVKTEILKRIAEDFSRT